MDREVFKDIQPESYQLTVNDYIIASALKGYLETLSIEDARERLEKVFPSRVVKNGAMRVSAPELVVLIKDAQTATENETVKWSPENADALTAEIMNCIKDTLSEHLKAEEYVKDVPYGVIDMLHDCHKAIESATGIYRFS